MNFPHLLVLIGFLIHAPWASGFVCDEAHRSSQASVSGPIKRNSFVSGRTLQDYKIHLEKSFSQVLNQLEAQDLWIDLGAGKGRAGLEFLESFQNLQQAPRVALIAYKLDRWLPFPRFQGKLILKEGQLFEDMNLTSLGQARLMTDVFGVLSYTKDLHHSLGKVFRMLQVGGILFIRTDASYTVFLAPDGQRYNFDSFLKNIPGLLVEGGNGILKITKTTHTVSIPRFRVERYLPEELPPVRRYLLLDSLTDYP